MSDASRLVDLVLAALFFFLGYVWYSLGEGLRGLMAVGAGISWLFTAVFWDTDSFRELDRHIIRKMLLVNVAALFVGLVVGYVVYGIPGQKSVGSLV